MDFGIITNMCNHHHSKFQSIFLTSESPYPLAINTLTPHPSSTNLFTVLVDLSILGISYKWDHEMNVWLLLLNMFKIHHCSM